MTDFSLNSILGPKPVIRPGAVTLIMTLVALVFPLSRAGASILLEPSLFTEAAGTMTASLYTGVPDVYLDVAQKSSGSGLGLKIGYAAPLMFWAAADLMTETGKLEAVGIGAQSSDMSRTMTFLDLGITFPILLRVWVGLALSNQLTAKPSSGDINYSGGGSKIGISYTGLPFLALNVEYVVHQYNKISAPGLTAGDDIGTYYQNLAPSSVFVSISAPFHL